ncbi:efflux RND transporter periplasmic adaptor subunit [Pseudoalteromonas phenolica]|uniref:efflux RND transporter periplasmic adaptor subunit n=1 Tax=Pseudoalteromonas phenolica TaxID=161398 RepID=UPI00110B4212|nr:efflux RND transporter periplasmic adaptor subunit [Pseudoalteromonas phenolica]TMO56053.1 efflux transporter periplasmic adaptor subunit [Pseudoalteromonas phenolica]
MSKFITNAVLLSLGIAAGSAGMYFYSQSNAEHSAHAEQSDEKKPLYWVAPMDSNYRRDKPGKSPMGMDLIPVYEESNSEDEHGPGAIQISPEVINNLGVRTAKVTLRDMTPTINTVGYIQYDEDNLVHIHPRVSGWVEQLFVKTTGQKVKKGQALYTLYSPELVNAQQEFLIALRGKEFGLIEAAKARLRALHIDDIFIEQLQRNKNVSQNVTFYAPQNGVVANLKIREGYYVQPGTTMMSIGDLSNVWVEAEVFERDAASVTVGLPVHMTLDYQPARAWHGEVDYIYPTLDEKNRTLRVRLRFENKDGALKPNMYAQLQISGKAKQDSILTPIESVIRTGKQNRVVLALGDGQFKSIAVQIGQVYQDQIEVLEGLNEGDTVVTSAQFLIDSESSKSSDFKRMEYAEVPTSVWAEGVITAKSDTEQSVTIDHAPVEAWQWPQMVMDFGVLNQADFDALEVGHSLHFEITKQDDGSYPVSAIHIMGKAEVAAPDTQATVNGVINAIDLDARVINISREAIEKWGRGPATMDFEVIDELDISTLKTGDNIEFTFDTAQDFKVIAINKIADKKAMQDGDMPMNEHAHH